MERRIVEFAEVLRQNGLAVATSEVGDAASAAASVELADRAIFRAALRASLCKRLADVETFERAFELYFTGAAATLARLDAALLERIRESGLLEPRQLELVAQTVNRLLDSLSPLTQAALSGDQVALARLLRGAALTLDFSRLETPLQGGFFSRRLLAGAGAEKMRTDLESIGDELRRRGLEPAGLELASNQLAETMRRVEEAARKLVNRQIQARVRRTAEVLSERPFHALTKSEVERVQLAIRRLAERIKTRLSRRSRSRRRGALNVHRTLRANMGWGGVPMRPVFRGKRKHRPEVVVLCDVSDSVRNVSRMMLLFMHTLQSMFARVRSFVFVSDVGEVTRHFRQADTGLAIDLATAGREISIHANSNYGRALATFSRVHLASISRRTTVLVIGDGRNNYNAANAWALAELRRRCHRLFWICPEDRRSWGLGDSEMALYARHCHRVVTVQTLSDLERVAEGLVQIA